jgi:hypothetical protein
MTNPRRRNSKPIVARATRQHTSTLRLGDVPPGGVVWSPRSGVAEVVAHQEHSVVVAVHVQGTDPETGKPTDVVSHQEWAYNEPVAALAQAAAQSSSAAA